MYGEAFDKCIGCSNLIVQEYKKNREEFVINACNRPDYLEDLTGISDMMKNVNFDDVQTFDFDDEEIEAID